MMRGLGLLDSDDEQPSAVPDRAAEAIHAAGLDSAGDDAEIQDQAVSDDRPGFSEDLGGAGNDFKTLGLDGSEDEFVEQRDVEDEEGRQPSPGPKTSKPVRNYGPPEVWKVPLVEHPAEPLRIITLKSMVDIESTPYNAEDFTLDSTFSCDDPGKKILRPPVLNRIRYRFREDVVDADKGLQLESNSRIVRWSDGSLSLMIGRECIDLSEEPVEGQRMLLGLHHSDLQGQQLLKSRLLLRPPAHDSDLHRNMTHSLALARQASTKVKANPVLQDFGHEHMEALDRDKEQLKLREKQSKASKRRYTGLTEGRRPVSQRISVPFLEADDDDDDDYGQPRASLGSQQAEAQEKRLLQVKQGKRPRFLADENDDVALSDDDEPPQNRPKRNALLDSDDEF
eukprot:jgi/Ulvmu1/11563/UM079_0006.1